MYTDDEFESVQFDEYDDRSHSCGRVVYDEYEGTAISIIWLVNIFFFQY